MPGTLKSYKQNTFMITKKIFVYCYAFNHSFVQNIFFNEGYFYSRGFQNIQGLLWKIQGLFKDTMLFQGLFKTRVNHAKRP